MTRASSPLGDRMVFLVGARRSGTNWLQRILGAHPAVATVPSESALFSHGLAPLADRFQHTAKGSPQTGKVYMQRDAMLDALRDFADAVFGGLLDKVAGAERLVERTPDHVRHLGLIGDVYPDAWFIHIIRDGRDVARSLVSQPWGPETLPDAAEEWRSAIEAARRDAPRLHRYLEVRYEELLGHPTLDIRSIFEWLGLDHSDNVVERALTEAGVRFNVDPEQDAIGSGKWRSTFTDADTASFERVAGATLRELGYDTAQPVASESLRSERNPRTLHGALGNALRRLSRPRYDGRAETKATLAVVDRFIAAVVARDADGVESSLAADVYVRIVEPARTNESRGASARALLVETMLGDDALGGTQIVGDIHPGRPLFTFVGSFVTAAGERADRVIAMHVADDRIARCVYYRFA